MDLFVDLLNIKLQQMVISFLGQGYEVSPKLINVSKLKLRKRRLILKESI